MYLKIGNELINELLKTVLNPEHFLFKGLTRTYFRDKV